VAETLAGAEGANRFVGVPAGLSPEWAGTACPAFTVDTEPVTAKPLGLPPAENAPSSGASPADEGASAEEPASFAAADAAWVLLGAALPAFRRPEERRRPAPAARRRWF
jgi:hypothetical protein